MGFDLELFVNADAISRQLVCSICGGVLEKPVQTECEHLFCEDELLQWGLRQLKCPLDNLPLQPTHVTQPSRIILTMLAELKRKCSYHSEGCSWVGELGHAARHERHCEYCPRTVWIERMAAKSAEVTALKQQLAEANRKIHDLEECVRTYISLAKQEQELSKDDPAEAEVEEHVDCDGAVADDSDGGHDDDDADEDSDSDPVARRQTAAARWAVKMS